jgi:hypothetical protein
VSALQVRFINSKQGAYAPRSPSCVWEPARPRRFCYAVRTLRKMGRTSNSLPRPPATAVMRPRRLNLVATKLTTAMAAAAIFLTQPALSLCQCGVGTAGAKCVTRASRIVAAARAARTRPADAAARNPKNCLARPPGAVASRPHIRRQRRRPTALSGLTTPTRAGCCRWPLFYRPTAACMAPIGKRRSISRRPKVRPGYACMRSSPFGGINGARAIVTQRLR